MVHPRIWKFAALLLAAFVAADGSFAKGSSGHSSGSSRSSSGVVSVRGYTKSNGTYVAPHHRSAPDGDFSNNWSTNGNVNPFTGKPGTKTHPPDGYGSSRRFGSSNDAGRASVADPSDKNDAERNG